MNEILMKAITGMSSAEAEVRVLAATEIYRTGRALADHAVYPWKADAELAELLGGASGQVNVGLAVTPEHFAAIREANGSPRLAEVPPDQDAMEFELHLPGGLSVDVLTSCSPEGDGAIAKYLRKTGEGVQQVEYRCANVERATEILREKFGVKAVYAAAQSGADGTRVNFFLVEATGAGKVLIELYEEAARME